MGEGPRGVQDPGQTPVAPHAERRPRRAPPACPGLPPPARGSAPRLPRRGGLPPPCPGPERSQARFTRPSAACMSAFPQAHVTRLQRSPFAFCPGFVQSLSRQGCEAQGVLNRQKGSRHCQTPCCKGTERGRARAACVEPGVSSKGRGSHISEIIYPDQLEKQSMFGMQVSFLPPGKSEAPLNYLNCSMACPMILVLHALHWTLLHFLFFPHTGGLVSSLPS